MATSTARSGEFGQEGPHADARRAHEGAEPGPTFEFGLVLAGAISAGAYTAGVIDFLLQALDCWEEAKAREPHRADLPQHQVRLRVLAGSSAGGITAALAAGMLGEDFVHADPRARPSGAGPAARGEFAGNKLYEFWVRRIGIERLLKTKDLDRDEAVRSFLDSTALEELAADAFEFGHKPGGDPPDRPYLAQPLDILLTLTNLRGVPYRYDLEGTRATNYQMRLHADFMHFELGREGSGPHAGFEPRWLQLRHCDRYGWDLLRRAALATAAFPFGLAPQRLHRKVDEYTNRDPNPFAIRDVAGPGGAPPRTLAPYWPDAMPDDYDFLCVDGGVIDNEPLALAQRVLLEEHRAGGPEADPARAGGAGPEDAAHALVMVDPFPNDAPFPAVEIEATGTNGLLRLGAAFVRCLVDQARFKPEELEEAIAPSNCTRFLIEPTRYTAEGRGPEQPYAIACGAVGGFGGFLCEAFRRHDYQLGRFNCQQFLKKYFVLDARNPCLGRRRRSALARFEVRRAKKGGAAWTRDEPLGPVDHDERVYLPIIPLIGAAEAPVEPLGWPRLYRRELEALREPLRARLRRIGDLLIAEQGLAFPKAGALQLLWHTHYLERAVAAILGYVEDDLRRRGLLGGAD